MTTQPEPAPVVDVAALIDPYAIPANRILDPALVAAVGEADAERITENANEIERLNTGLLKHAGAALIDVGKAAGAFTSLMSSAVFDIEYVEGDLGTDVVAELATAARALRNVERIALMRHEMLLNAKQAAAADATGAGS